MSITQKLVVVGVGSIGRRHGRLLASRGDISVELCDHPRALSEAMEETEAALLMDYVHQPDLLYWMLGKSPAGVYASGSMGGNLELKSNPNSVTLLLDYDDPLTASIHLNYIQYPDRYHYEFLGDFGWIYYDMNANILHYGD